MYTREDVQRLSSELAELRAVAEEEELAQSLANHDAELLRLELRATLQRCQERAPPVEEIAERYEAKIDELSAELRHLQEENALLALHHETGMGIGLLGEQDRAVDDDEACSEALSQRSARQRLLERGRVDRAAAEAQRLHSEAKEVWKFQAKSAARSRRCRVNEWYLVCMRQELQEVAQGLKGRSQQLRALQRKIGESESQRQQLACDREKCHEDLELGREELVQLHKQALEIREACVVPAQLKKKSSALMRCLDQEGGRLNIEKRMRGLEAAAKLYQNVALHAPSLQPLASRAKTSMEAEFARYRQLEQQHSRLLQQLQINVMREALSPRTAPG